MLATSRYTALRPHAGPNRLVWSAPGAGPRAGSTRWSEAGWPRPAARRPRSISTSCSQHHAWRARLWEERRPGLPSHFVPNYDGPNYDGNGSAIDGLTILDDDVGRLSAYCRVVLPRLVVGYRSWQMRCSAASDQPVARALSFALADVVADWERGSGLLQGHLDGDGDGQAAASAADAARDMDRLLALKGVWPSRQCQSGRHVLGGRGRRRVPPLISHNGHTGPRR